MYAARPEGRALQPSTSYHLLNRARRRCEIAVAIIFANPGPSGPEETAESHSDFARRKFSTDLQVRVPRNGGPGVSRHWRTKFASAASPGDPQGELPRRGKRRWPGPLGTFPSCWESTSPRRAKPSCNKRKGSITAPSSAPFGGTCPYPLCRFATSPLDKGSRPPGGRLKKSRRRNSPHTTNPIRNLSPHPPQCEHWGTFPPRGRL